MSNTVTGVIVEISETIQVSDKFKKRDLVIEAEEGQYKNFNQFQLVQDKCSIGDNFAVGQEVEVSYNIRSNKPKDRWFTNLTAWRVVATEQAPQAQPQATAPSTPIVAEADADDLPF